MKMVSPSSQKLVYLGSIDDKVVEYAGVADPESQLLRSLFFSSILGDPLVLNDGYLLHSVWGRAQLTNPDSAVRRLNSAGHLLLAARDHRRYSEWIPEQATRTASYKGLYQALKPRELSALDQAWEQCRGIRWPSLNVQDMMRRLMTSQQGLLLEDGIAASKLDDHRKRWQDRMPKQSVRAAWESAMADMGDTLNPSERATLMEFANEIYHASFACAFSAEGDGGEVGVAASGQRRLHRCQAYRAQDGSGMEAMLRSASFAAAGERLEHLATIFVMRPDQELFRGSRMEEFLARAAGAKSRYRESLAELFSSRQPVPEKIEQFESALCEYSDCLRSALQPKSHSAVLRLVKTASTVGTWMEARQGYLEVACRISDKLLSTPLEDARALLTAGLPVVDHVYEAVQGRRGESVSLLPQSQSSFELSLDRSFVRDATADIPVFSST